MKIRDSGMLDESNWESLFDVPLILTRLDVGRFHDVVELGCGYGTFTVPIAKEISGAVYSFDLEPAMIARTNERGSGLGGVCPQRDVLESGFGTEADAALLFNVLHCDQPIALLRHEAKALQPGGEVLVIYWRYGDTPRGPGLEIRPKPEQVVDWAKLAGLKAIGDVVDLPPWHYGLRFGERASA